MKFIIIIINYLNKFQFKIKIQFRIQLIHKIINSKTYSAKMMKLTIKLMKQKNCLQIIRRIPMKINNLQNKFQNFKLNNKQIISKILINLNLN